MTTMNDLLTVGHLIDNELTDSDRYDDVVDPGRLSDVAARVAVGTPDDVDRAVKAAHRAYLSWRNVDPAERARLMLAAADALAGSGSDLAAQLVREHGGMLWEAQTDFGLGTGVMQHTASLVDGFFDPVQFDDDESFISVERVPRGVVGAVVPWNMPVVLTMMKLAPALATGNTIVIKPSPFAPAALTVALHRMAQTLPAGVINVVHGNADVGQALTSHPLVRKIGFTGGTATAGRVMAAAAGTIKNLTLELGGNDPAIVLDDVDIDAALDRMLKGVFTRSGQICFAVKRIYVPRALYGTFADAFCERVDQYSVGHGLDESASFGPMNNKTQYDSVNALIEETKNSSAKIVQLGRKLDSASDGYYILPHVVRDVEHSAPVSSCEQFGPVIPLIAYDDENQVVEWANDSEYGLGSSVWTTDPDRGLAIARRIEAGSTFINTHAFESLDLRMPFGGVKQSGIGREFGEAGMREYVDEHSIRLLK
ncbi:MULTISPECIES: aldehyde dehydrogenase family protein [unclassified Rhodococcus (in: high G+C Gram-positive bacteria)]|uniref:aldehyde dehydrogenase family protein n=1 Tax=unclassified Rhodococcus (in: high G+C Gram-positive bacteria) TaxID=192944 RepID=UPI000B9C103F|nr:MULTISPECIES: aldehyde dehydrogenase family protein [unclassified Rhodococcus (in: high G+C Gram-positive bacteria)]MDI6630162.1 aldehyde dehydrogenase family protein [Rhodococcus sp. (in: high G+C Gram-positive bacteria)]OZE31253.1 aldehyde dehydrogenase [Rhodococcus sp. 05-2254-4]OZE41837.1 aldehyde dehydrogenase [Rhodococcus sp. 05-2254-3]OZE52272.1 aldehyde dehydrogenase [Rhodococcus sp. 05-2254-2]